MDYNSKLTRLEHLHDLVERYVPLMYSSTEEGKGIHREICEVYGEVSDVFEEIVGRQHIEVPNGGGPGHRRIRTSSKPGSSLAGVFTPIRAKRSFSK